MKARKSANRIGARDGQPGPRFVKVLFCFALALGLAVIGVARAGAPLPPPPSDPQDISGIWFGSGFYDPVNRFFKPIGGGEPPFTPEGLAIFTKRREANDSGHPIRHGECAPVGFPGEQEGAPFQVIQTPGQITFVYESNHVFTIVHMNQEHPKNLRPSFMGHSIGHWEGDTLVIDTIGYNGEKWLDYLGTPSSTQLHVIERIKKVNVGKVVLENTLTIIDPVMYTRPWDIRRVFMWRPAEQIGEEICEEDNDQVAPRDAVH
jgi:hypothetical protein